MKERKNKLIKIGFSIGVFCIFTAIILLVRFSQRTVDNPEGAEGNTACNLYNGGIFCEDEDRIYFSNLKDGGALYSMSKELDDFKYEYEDTAGYINLTNAYIVYSRLNYLRSDSVKHVLQFSTSGLYRLNKKGRQNIKSLYYSNIGLASLSGNDVFYQKLEKGGKMNLYKTELGKKRGTLLLEKNVIPGSVRDGKLYYAGTGKNHYIYYLDTKTGSEHEFYKGNCYQPAFVGSHVYFISASQKYNLARVNKDGKQPLILVKERCSFYNVTEDEKYIIYQVDDALKNRIEMMNLETLEKKVIKEGDYNSITIVGGKVFFREFGTDEVYYFSLDNPSSVSTFNPPDLTENKEKKGV